MFIHSIQTIPGSLEPHNVYTVYTRRLGTNLYSKHTVSFLIMQNCIYIIIEFFTINKKSDEH